MKKGRDFLKTIRGKFITTTHSHNQSQKKMDTSERYCYNPTLNWKKEVEEYFIKAYGSEHFSRVSKALTRPSCYTCIRVNTLKSTSDAVIEKLLSILHGSGLRGDDISISKIDVIATAGLDVGHKKGSFSKDLNPDQLPNRSPMVDLRLFGDGDPIEAGLQSFPINKCQLPGLDYVLFVKGSGPHTIDYCSVPNESLKEVIVSRKCAEAVLRGAQVFVPGVLACSAHVEKGDKVAVSVAVEQPLDNGWGVGITRGTVLQGSPTDPHYLERRGLYIGQGTAMLSRAGTFRATEGIAVDMSLMADRVFSLPSLHDVLGGEIFLQNLPSIITAHALDPQPGDRVLDMCAAPGGKTTAIAILMKDEGEVIAADRSHNKVLEIKKLAAEMGLNCITAYRLDALKAVCQSNESIDSSAQLGNKDSVCVTSEIESKESWLLENTAAVTENPVHTDLQCKESVSDEKTGQESYLTKAEIRKNIRRMRNGPGRNQTLGGRVENSKGFPPNSFDRILLDPPCSALGLRPRLFAGEVTIESLRGHRTYQRKMFDQAVQLVRPGGVIVYSTCTINPGENEALVRYALDKYKFLSLAPQHPRIGGPGLVGRCELYDGQRVEEWLRPGEEELVQRFDPSSPLDTIGFFIAKFNVGQKDT